MIATIFANDLNPIHETDQLVERFRECNLKGAETLEEGVS
jgi:hypothetical protein